MQVEQLTLPKKVAEETFGEYKKLLTERASMRKIEAFTELKSIYGHLRHGRAAIDVYASFRRIGLNEGGDPKMAVCRADTKRVFLSKREKGGAIYSDNNGWKIHRADVIFPQESFDWPRDVNGWAKNSKRQALVPIVPAKFLLPLDNRYALGNLYLIWEVAKWKPMPPKDPILAKRITPNIFIVLATWELTPLERAVIRGRTEIE